MQKIISFLAAILGKMLTAVYGLVKREPGSVSNNRTIINVRGSAMQVKGRAAVVGEITGIYFVEGIADWEEPWLNHRIRVIGDLETRAGRGRLIKNAVIQLLEEKPSL
jgi:hypothetical protein